MASTSYLVFLSDELTLGKLIYSEKRSLSRRQGLTAQPSDVIPYVPTCTTFFLKIHLVFGYISLSLGEV